MSRSIRTVGACLLALAASCVHGTQPKDYPPAVGPEGALVFYRLAASSSSYIEGELFAVDTAGALILNRRPTRSRSIAFAEGRLVRIPWSAMKGFDVDKLSRPFDLWSGEIPRPAVVAQIALVSRFPGGLTDERLAQVLRAIGQQQVEEVR
jgi:hypothetical protein